MNIIISILYAPLVFFLLHNYNIIYASAFILLLSLFWFLSTLFQNNKAFAYPLVYLLFSMITLKLGNFDALKIIPLLFSLFFSVIIITSYINKSSIILYFAQRFSKHEISENEKEYIHISTLFWFFISIINCTIHLLLFLENNIQMWMFYSSIGWYILFITAGILQFLHRRYFFLRGKDV